MKNITVFSGFNKPLENKNLREFLRDVKNGRFRAEVEKIRYSEKEMKKRFIG